jgi:pimeloyl-ACP methyl ester carboxylesterase
MSALLETRTVSTPDGRELCVEIAGEPSERAILVHNGTPNSRHLYGPWIEDAAARGARLISYDRPGYGGSTPRAGYSVADGARDVQAIADALAIERLVVWGISGGGPYAAACAALLPELVAAVGVLGSIAPWGVPGLDYFAGMGDDNVRDIKLYFQDRHAAREDLARQREEMLEVTSEDLAESMRSLLSETDAAVVTGEFAQWLTAAMHAGLAPGVQGWWDDGVAHMSPWGFEFESIRVPTKVWHGRHDRFVPFQHGQWLAANIPGAEAELSETDGHLTLVTNRVPEVHEWLLARLDGER